MAQGCPFSSDQGPGWNSMWAGWWQSPQLGETGLPVKNNHPFPPLPKVSLPRVPVDVTTQRDLGQGLDRSFRGRMLQDHGTGLKPWSGDQGCNVRGAGQSKGGSTEGKEDKQERPEPGGSGAKQHGATLPHGSCHLQNYPADHRVQDLKGEKNNPWKNENFQLPPVHTSRELTSVAFSLPRSTGDGRCCGKGGGPPAGFRN